MIRIKICGITKPADAVAAAAAGADAIGLVFAKSPRQVTVAQARRIVAALPPYVSAVGVFVNARVSTVIRIVGEVGLGEVQLHGDESPAFAAKLGALRVTRVLRVRDRSFVDQVRAFSGIGVEAIVLDAYSRRSRGGTGRQLDWDLVASARKAGALDGAPFLVLAGGLTHLNVKAGIRRIGPWGVDVSSGVESEPGIKSAELISRFITAVRTVSLSQ